MPIKFFLATLFAIAFLLNPASAEEPRRGGTLRITLTADIRSIDGSRNDANTDAVLHHIFETLIALKNDMTIGPALADSWQVPADGKSYTFRLREGATYHNGDRVLAADIKWLWERRMGGAAGPWLCKASFDGSRGLKVEAVEALDERTVVFRIDAPNTLFLTRLADPICNFWAASPKNVGPDGNWIANSAIGSGPFKFKEWRKEQYIALERFAGYVPSREKRDGYSGDRTAYVDEVRFVIIPDKTTAETALIAGQIDVVSTLQASRMEDIRKRGVSILSAPGLSLSAILIQTNDPLLSNVKLRLAMAHALDLALIAEVKTDGMSQHNPSGVPQASAYFEPSFQTSWPAYDPELAKRLVAESGYRGQVIKLQTNKRYIGMYENAVLVQSMLTAVGIKVELDVIDWAAQLENYFSGKFQLQSFGYGSRADPMVIYGMLIGQKATTPNAQWDNPDVYALYLRALAATEFDERRALLRQLQTMMAEQVPILGLYYYPVIEAVSPKLVGYESWALDKPRAWGVWRRA
ncbi:MAG: ABC transporter substrate-binding protein [Rhizobiales bacterium]|nr:ABC transporter substrate-binding protein [Hyphomicrobiales bacterium]